MALLSLALMAFATVSWAADAPPAHDAAALAKASQNPVADLISLPFENNFMFDTTKDDVFLYNLNIKPVIPMGLTENFNLINRAIIPVLYQDSGIINPTTGQDIGSQFGLGDIIYQGFVSPKAPGKFIWGIGPEIHFPTGTDRFTADQWAAGPALVVLAMPGHWVLGGVLSNVWNIGNGYNDAEDVNKLTFQYFINYNMEGGWYINSGPVLTADWEADSGQQWTVPVGAGLGRVFKLGKRHINAKLGLYYNVEAPDGNDDVWNLQFQWTFLYPKAPKKA